MICQHCESTKDVIDFYIGEKKHDLCVDCRFKLLAPKRNAGRPSLGITKKVSITLPEKDWEWLEENSMGNTSETFRGLIQVCQQSSESEWSNNAALGYAILGAKQLGYDEEQTRRLVRAIYSEFDIKSIDEAKTAYERSPY